MHLERAKQAQSDSKTVPPHGMIVFRLFEAKQPNASVLVAKVHGAEIVLDFLDENEEDICKHFKVKHASKEFFAVVLDRCKLRVDADKGLVMEFDWTGIPRLKQIAAEKAAKLAEKQRLEEEARLAKEKREAEERAAKEKAAAEEEKRRKEEERRRADAEALKKKQEEERKRLEEVERKKAFEDSIIGGLTNPNAVMAKLKKHHDEAEESEETKELELAGITKTWSDEHQDFYYYDEATNELSWRDPRIKSEWEKKWDADNKAFIFLNKETGEQRSHAPWSSEWYRQWDAEKKVWTYVSMVSGDSSFAEPAY